MSKEVKFPNIRSELSTKGITLIELADAMKAEGVKKISSAALSNKLSGRRNFMPDEMLAISKILKKDMYLLFFNIEYTKCIRDGDNLYITK